MVGKVNVGKLQFFEVVFFKNCMLEVIVVLFNKKKIVFVNVFVKRIVELFFFIENFEDEEVCNIFFFGFSFYMVFDFLFLL